MASPLRYKVYDSANQLVAALRYGEDAAQIVASFAEGAKVKYDGKIVWREGKEFIPAEDSYDNCASVMRKRIKANNEAALAKLGIKL